MKVLRRVIIGIGILLTLFGVSVAALVFEAKRQKTLAQNVALREVTKLLSDAKLRKRSKIPVSLQLSSVAPADTDLFERRWQIWYLLEPTGAIRVLISAPKGIAFIPLFNQEKDLAISEVEFDPEIKKEKK